MSCFVIFESRIYFAYSMKNIIIIWAGAAWLMAAASTLEWEQSSLIRIHIFEKNLTPGKKVILSWWWRCNLTTGNEDKKILSQKYTRGWDFIRKSIGKFGPKKVQEWFSSHEVPLKMESDLRVFPTSNDGKDIVRVFENIFHKYHDRVTLHFEEGVLSVRNNHDTYSITTPKGVYECDILVITTWGNAYSHTGSSGDGYAFARTLGHTITTLGPSLSSFLTEESWLHELSGLVFPNAKIQISPEISLTGSLLCTHFGISWPLAFMTSSQLAWNEIQKNKPYAIYFSPIQEMNYDAWETYQKVSFETHPKKSLINVLSDKLSRRFAEWFMREYFPHLEHTFVCSISRSDRESISSLLGKWIPITLLERRPGDEFVTAGGVDTSELSPETMESKIHKNLYFAGEVLNVDGYTGGYSLQICWSSGYSVWKSILQKLLKVD